MNARTNISLCAGSLPGVGARSTVKANYNLGVMSDKRLGERGGPHPAFLLIPSPLKLPAHHLVRTCLFASPSVDLALSQL